MRIQSNNQTQQSFRRNVSFMFVMYWGILVFWQNISGAENRGAFDIVVKIGLLVYFVSFYLRRAKTLNLKIFIVFMLAISLIITALGEPQFTLGIIVSYVYPILLLSMVYGFGDTFEINQSQLVSFCNCIIAITMYAALYAVIFCWDQFAGALSLSNAYGNELSAFFISNHEYGMYLVAALISCSLCFKHIKKMTTGRKIFYIIAIIIFSVNLLLTFSRTSYLGIFVYIITYILIEKSKARKWIALAMVLVVIAVIMVPTISNFTFNILLKENTTAGRDVLFNRGVQYYQNGSLIEKMFGYGVQKPRTHFETYYDHGSVHNGYLQVLLYYGFVGLLFMIVFLIYQIAVRIRFVKQDRHIGAVSLGLLLSAAAMMLTNTAIMFTSSIDSYFLTIFFIVVPKYLCNSVRENTFYIE